MDAEPDCPPADEGTGIGKSEKQKATSGKLELGFDAPKAIVLIW